MAAAFALINLAGFVALLLWGVRMVQTGVERALGGDLRRVLAIGLGKPGKAFFAGLGVTALLQSSTATGLMVSAFASAGMIALVPALSAMLGANVGTTLIVQIVTFDIMAVVPVLFLAGVVMYRGASNQRIHDFGRVAIGLGLILMSLDRLVASVTPLQSMPDVTAGLAVVGHMPILALLAAAVVTWAAHSSVAVVLLVGSLVTAGVVPMEAGFAMVLGANIGTAINPVLETSGGRDAASRRVPVGNLVFRLIGVLVVLGFLPEITPVFQRLEGEADRCIADFHTVFNVVLAIVFYPLLGTSARMLERFLPAAPEAPDPARPVYLDRTLLASPGLAVEAAAREADRLAAALAAMLDELPAAVAREDAPLAAVRTKGRVVDALAAAIRDYLDTLDRADLAAADRQRLIASLVFVTNIDHAAEAVVEMTHGHATRRDSTRAVVVGDESIAALAGSIAIGTRSAAAAFAAGAAVPPPDVAALEPFATDAVTRATAASLAALRAGEAGAAEASAVVLEVLRQLRHVAGFVVAAVEDPMAPDEDEVDADAATA